MSCTCHQGHPPCQWCTTHCWDCKKAILEDPQNNYYDEELCECDDRYIPVLFYFGGIIETIHMKVEGDT